MALPPWTVDLLRRGVADLARQVSDPESTAALKQQAIKLAGELPSAARDKVESLLKQADATLRDRTVYSGEDASTSPLNAINASGQLHATAGGMVSQAAIAAGTTYLASDDADLTLREQFHQTISDAIAAQTQCRSSVLVTQSFDAGLALIASMGQRGCRLVVPRCCAVPLANHGSSSQSVLADHLRSAGARVSEIGTIHAARAGDFDPLRTEHADRNTLVHLWRESCQEIGAFAAEASLKRIAVLPQGRLWSRNSQHPPIPSAVEIFDGSDAPGADAVLLRGGVWTGTSEVGVVMATSEIATQLRQSRGYKWLLASPASTAMVAEAVQTQRDGRLPIDEYVAASEDNLRDRAERLATQLSDLDGVSSVSVTANDAAMTVDHAIASRQVRLALNEGSATSIAARLKAHDPCVLASADDQSLTLDLRWVSPNDQSKLATAVIAALTA
ncbi:MAG: hypothetical protein AAF745_05025 [Planctomycetota bacterium]